MESKICTLCNVDKPLTEYYAPAKYKGKVYYRRECKACHQAKHKEAKVRFDKAYKSTEEYREKRKIYRKTSLKAIEGDRRRNRKRSKTEKRKKWSNQYTMNRYYNDELFKLKFNVRNRIRNCIKKNKWRKDNKTVDLIGCSFEFLKSYLESQFQVGMSWDNHGEHENNWQIDHIIPLHLAKSEEELKKLCHFTNLQPLWNKDHKIKTKEDIKKGAGF